MYYNVWIFLFFSQHFLCVERAKYKDAFCELDQGGPLILQGGEDDKKPTQLMMMKKYQRIIAVNSKNHKVHKVIILWRKLQGGVAIGTWGNWEATIINNNILRGLLVIIIKSPITIINIVGSGRRYTGVRCEQLLIRSTMFSSRPPRDLTRCRLDHLHVYIYIYIITLISKTDCHFRGPGTGREHAAFGSTTRQRRRRWRERHVGQRDVIDAG